MRRLAIGLAALTSLGCGSRSPLDAFAATGAGGASSSSAMASSSASGAGAGGSAGCSDVSTNVDGLVVHFLDLPTTDITDGLTPASFSAGAQFEVNGSDDLGATNPFNYSPTLDGSPYARLRGGTATYAFDGPRAAMTILWGTVDDSNMLELFGADGASVGAVSGTALSRAATRTLGGKYVFDSGLHLLIEPAATFTSLKTTAGTDEPFEYSNLTTTTASCR